MTKTEFGLPSIAPTGAESTESGGGYDALGFAAAAAAGAALLAIGQWAFGRSDEELAADTIVTLLSKKRKKKKDVRTALSELLSAEGEDKDGETDEGLKSVLEEIAMLLKENAPKKE